METDINEMMAAIFRRLEEIKSIKAADIPEIDLYMDQLTTFMDGHLGSLKRYPDDKILTKTMINNYAKNNLLPAPVKKKYAKDHSLLLILIYYFKNFLSIRDIEMLLRPLTEEHFGRSGELSLAAVYDRLMDSNLARIEPLIADLRETLETSAQAFKDTAEPAGDEDYLTLLSYICSLSFDVYWKKFVIEQLIDALPKADKDKKK